MELTIRFSFFIFLIGLCLQFNGTCWAVEMDPGCNPTPEDEFAVNARLPRAAFNEKYAGDCLLATTNRGIRQTSRARVRGPRPAEQGPFLYVANFKHQMKFWIAEIPIHGIQDFIMQQEVDKSDLAFHHQLRIRMKPEQPILLYPQTGPNSQNADAATNPLEIRDWVMTAYNLRTVSAGDLKFSPLRAIKGYFVQAFVFSSIEDIWKYETTGDRDFRQYLLIMDEERKSELIQYYVQRFDQIRESKIYHLLLYNCIIELFDGFFATRKFGSDLERRMFDVFTLRQTLPSQVLPMLEKLELIPDQWHNRLPNYRQEISGTM
jgi:hypothetical protein